MTDLLSDQWYAELSRSHEIYDTGTRYEVRSRKDGFDAFHSSHKDQDKADRERDRMAKRLPFLMWYVKPTEEILI